MAPPKMNVNISVIITGKMVTSISCAGKCLIFSGARHPYARHAVRAEAGAGRSCGGTSTLRIRSGSSAEPGVGGVGDCVDDWGFIMGQLPRALNRSAVQTLYR